MRLTLLTATMCIACACSSFSATGVLKGAPYDSGATKLGVAGDSQKVAMNSTPVELTLKRLGSNTEWSLSDDRGSVVLLDVWATWCEPCRDALPVYDQLGKQFSGRGLKVYAINVDEDGSQIAKFLEEVRMALPVLIDPGALRSESQLHVKLMPTAYLIDRGGRVREVHEGFSEDAKGQYQSQIEALLTEPAP